MPTVSSNPASARENVTGWQRWNPGVLREEAPAQPPQESEESIRRRAYAAGLEEGKRAGVQAGYTEGKARAQAEAARVRQIAHAADAALQALGDTIAQKTVALAIAIAQKIIQRDIESHPENVVDVVRDALTLLPDGAERIRIIVNSADVALVQENMTQTGTLTDSTVVGSNEVQRGGCRITSPCGDIDATLETRIARVLEVLSATDHQPK